MRPFRPLAALIAMTMLLTACASAKPIGKLDAALPEENRIRLGAVGVASPCLPPEVAYRVPAKGGWAGAGRGAGVAAMGSGEASMDAARSGGGGAEVGAAILLLSPLTALVGTIVGAACAEPAEKVDAAEAVLHVHDVSAAAPSAPLSARRPSASGPTPGRASPGSRSR